MQNNLIQRKQITYGSLQIYGKGKRSHATICSQMCMWKTLLSICTCILPHAFFFSLYDPFADENNQVKSAILNPLRSTALHLLLWVSGPWQYCWILIILKSVPKQHSHVLTSRHQKCSEFICHLLILVGPCFSYK